MTDGEENMNKILLKLFLNMLYISALTFGGGFVIVTFMKKKFVDELQWIQEDEMLDMVAIAQSSPGAIAVNAAILVGHKIDGFIGMAVAVIGTIIPPMVILTAVSFFYESFFRNIYISMILSGFKYFQRCQEKTWKERKHLYKTIPSSRGRFILPLSNIHFYNIHRTSQPLHPIQEATTARFQYYPMAPKE